MAALMIDNEKTLNLGGPLIIDRAAPLKAELTEALSENKKVFLDISQAEDLDLSCLQVIYAARRSAAASGKELHFIGTIPLRIVNRLAASGFLKGKPEKAADFEASLTDFQ